MASIKGKLFEYFVYRLLTACSFKPVNPDGLLVYNDTAGVMVQGLGQPHNADVLLSPPMQTPFYYPTRLIVECKCYHDSIGLPQIRNALGLREDINHFEIVTEDILKNRQQNRTAQPKYYPMQRYVYQVAVASIEGFKSTAFPFAQAHRIPLISFANSSLFENIRQIIANLDHLALNDDNLGKQITARIKDSMQPPESNRRSAYPDCPDWYMFIEEIDSLAQQTTIGLLDDGTILFLLRATPPEAALYDKDVRDDGCMIYWSKNIPNTWVLVDRSDIYQFELPEEIYNHWVHTIGGQRRSALKIKRDYFSNIVLFGRDRYNRTNITVLHLSEKFMTDAEQSLEEEQ